MFFSKGEYEAVNRSGEATTVALIVAEIISCFKRSLARMLVIIVSLGFGIVKYVSIILPQKKNIQYLLSIKFRPRLGPTMQKVVGVGGLYFLLALIDAMFRINSVIYDSWI